MSTAAHCHPISVDEYLRGVSTIMKSPFPGVAPYLEQHWGDIHTRLMVYISDQINKRHIEIVGLNSGNRVVTAIELLSPANKMEESGRQAYRGKQFEYTIGHPAVHCRRDRPQDP